MSGEMGYRLAPQQERVVDALARREPSLRDGADAPRRAAAAGVSMGRAFRVQLVVRLARTPTPTELAARVRAAVERHPVLRLRLVPRPGARRPLQRFVDAAPADPVAAGILCAAPSPLEDVCRSEWERPFDLATEPPLRVVLVGDDARAATRFVLTAPALALDARAALDLAGELCGGAPLGADGTDALDWLGASAFFREWLEDEDDEDARADRAHFEHVDGEPSRWPRIRDLGALSADGERRAGFVRVLLPLAAHVAPAIAAEAARAEVPAEALWLAALDAVLARTSELARPLVRVASDGRGMEELTPVLGPLSRWLPVASRVDGRASVRSLAMTLARDVARAREHEHGHRDPDPAAGGGAEPAAAELEATGFARVDAELAGLGFVETLRAVEVDAPVIALLVERGKGEPELGLEVDADRVDRDAAEILAATLAAALASVAEAPEKAIRDQALVAPGPECERALGGPYASAREEAAPLFLERFAAAARAAPTRPALVSDTASLTYEELERRSRVLAARLRAADAGPERPVAVVMSRTHHAVVAILGALRAGAPYLPLDPVLPTDALGFRLEDADVAVVLTERVLLDRVPEGRPRWTLDVEALEPTAADVGVDEPLAPESAACLLYTSGSTGTPKAVAVEHRQLAAYLAAIEPRIGVGPGACWGNLSTLAADLGHTTLFPALATGGTLRLFGEESMGNARVLADQLRAAPIDVLKIVPSHLVALLDGVGGPEGERAILPKRVLVCGGEALPRSLVARIGDAVPTLLNHYGPTETTVGVAVGDARSAPADAGGRVPLGHPLGCARAYVLGPPLAPVPLGAVGELFVGGPTVSRGYHARGGLTAERFLPDPFSDEPGARMYRTGDRVRRLVDGSLVFLGRADFQVKVRGFRVEPGEVESAIVSHPDVAGAAVGLCGGEASGGARLVAWVAPRSGARLEPGGLREWLKPRLPAYMRPSAWVLLRALPLTPNGKVDRAALPEPDASRPETGGRYVPPRGRAERDIAAIWCELLGLERVGVEDNFFDLGGHSLLLVQLMRRLETQFEREIRITELFRHPTVAALARWLCDEDDALDAPRGRSAPGRAARRGAGDDAIAVVGLAARFPEAPSIQAFWDNLRAGRDGVRRLDREALLAAGVDAELLNDPHFVPASPILDDVDRFDASFFGIPPRQAQIMDPQHRLLLEVAWAALEHAGIAPGRSAGRVGVFAGAGLGSYFLHNLATAPALVRSVGVTAVRHANRVDNLATRVAYHLDLGGPAVTVQSGCSSSLAAVHLAVQSLLAGDADVVLAGGVTVDVAQGRGYRYRPGGINAPDGRCRAFDASASGTVFGSGVGVVVLKPLADALADGDTVHAVVLGSAMNNDGALKPGYTAPSVEGQAMVVAEALARAGVDPSDIDFVEAHGTGTAIGDPIEVAALARAFDGSEGRAATRGSCVLGSVKSSIGHLDAAAGIAGFLKAALALSHGEVPPTLHFERPNPRLDLERTPFRIATERVLIEKPPERRRAGVSSFGIGGTNVHVVLGGPPSPPQGDPGPTSAGDGATLLVLSARREDALDRIAEDLGRHLAERPDLALHDVAWTLATGRRAGTHRRTVVCTDRVEAVQALAGEMPDRVRTRVRSAREADVAFLFPGQGAQQPGMAARLHATDAAFREGFDAALAAVEKGLEHVGHPDPRALRALLLEPEAEDGSGRMLRAERLADTRLAQPALFAVELALASAWAARGVRPVALLGHSLGELVAATQAGVFALDDAARLVALRGQILAAQPRGTMLAVRAGVDEIRSWLAEPGGEGVHLSAVNGAADVTVGGAASAVDAFAARLDRDDVAHRRLATSHAFHVPQMEGAVGPFREAVSAVPRHAPAVPFVSVRTGTWIRDEEATDPEHWAAQLVEPVRFADALVALAERFDGVALEVGPGRTLASIVRREAAWPVVASLPNGAAEDGPISAALAELWLAGASIDWTQALPGGRGRRVPLPTYPFARERHWIDPTPGGVLALRAAALPAREGEALDGEDVGLGAASAGAPVTEEARADAVAPPIARTTGYTAPTSDRERILVGLWERVLGIRPIGVHDDFFELGGDSLQGLQMLSLAREAGYALDPEDLFDRQTIAALAEVMRPADGGSPRDAATPGVASASCDGTASAPQGAVRGAPRRIFPWTAEQRRWLGAGGAPVHVATVVSDDPGAAVPDEETLRAATGVCTERHGALRLRAARAGGEWVQRLVDRDRAAWLVATRDVPADGTLERALADLARELDPVEGPVAAAVRLRSARVHGREETAARLAILVHPLIADAPSFDVLVRDLLSASRGLALPEDGADPHAERFADFAEAVLLAALERGAEAPAAPGHLPRDHALGEPRASDRAVIVREAPGASRDLADLVAATASAVGAWTGLAHVPLGIAWSHGRAPQTVGCFAARGSVSVAVRDGGDSVDEVRRTITGTVAAPDGRLAGGDALPDVLVRVRSVAGGELAPGLLLEPISGSAPWTRHDARRLHAIEVELVAEHGDAPARLAIEYSTAVHRTETLERLADDVLARLAGASDEVAARPSDASLSPQGVSATTIRPADLEKLLATAQRLGPNAGGGDAR